MAVLTYSGCPDLFSAVDTHEVIREKQASKEIRCRGFDSFARPLKFMISFSALAGGKPFDQLQAQIDAQQAQIGALEQQISDLSVNQGTSCKPIRCSY